MIDSENNIAVLIPHYNYPDGLNRSVNSIRENVDVVIVDDGSDQKPNVELLSKKFNLGELIIINLDENKGIEEALNFGLKTIQENGKYKYIARLDCGDLCVKNRFSIQRNFLEKNEDYLLVGSSCTFIDLEGNKLFTYKYPSDYKILKKRMFINSMFIHPTVMFKIDVLDKVGYYPTNYKAAEDYAFFFEILKYGKCSNIKDVLVLIEHNPNGISAKKRKRQVINRIKIIIKHFTFGFYPIYGFVRSCVLLIVPLTFLNTIKKRVK